MSPVKTVAVSAVALLLLVPLTAMAAGSAPSVTPISLPGVSAHAGFDDMDYTPSLNRIIVPGGVSGTLFLIDPQTNAVSKAAQVSPPRKPHRHRDEGTSSAAYAHGYFIASNHNNQSLAIVDAKSGTEVEDVKLLSDSDYVRYFATVNEIWATEPDAHQIQIFRADFSAKVPILASIGTVSIPGGPESLEFDPKTGQAYTNLWTNETLAINVHTRKVAEHWHNTCHHSSGLALAPNKHLLFVACRQGKIVALNLTKPGTIAATAKTGSGVDIIAWNPTLEHLYVPGARSATLTILHLTATDHLERVTTVKTAKGAHCIATDGKSKAYVCDPRHGRILAVTDSK